MFPNDIGIAMLPFSPLLFLSVLFALSAAEQISEQRGHVPRLISLGVSGRKSRTPDIG